MGKIVSSISEGWETKQLKNIAPLQRGFDLPYSQIKNGKYPVVFSNGIGTYNSTFMVKGPGVTTGRSGTIGKVFYIDNDFWPHNTTLWVSDFCGNYELYVFYLLQTINWNNYNSGSGVPTLNRNDVHDLELSIPKFAEQKQIASALSDVDNMIASLEKLIEKKKAIKQGAMQELLTGIRRLKGCSKEWRTELLGQVSKINTGDKNNEQKVDGGKYPFFVRSKQIERIDTFSYDGEAILVPGEGNIGEIFHYINGKFDWHQRVYKISDFAEHIYAKYIYYQMQFSFGKYALKNTVKATVDSLRLPTFENYKFGVPSSIEEQKAIADVLDDMDKEIAELEQKLAKCRQLKQGMMEQLLTGKIRLI